MANIQQIVDVMEPAEYAIGLQMGCDLTWSAPELRTAVRVCDALIGVVIGVLVDQGVLRGNGQALTLGVFNSALNAALAQTYTPTPPPGPPPN